MLISIAIDHYIFVCVHFLLIDKLSVMKPKVHIFKKDTKQIKNKNWVFTPKYFVKYSYLRLEKKTLGKLIAKMEL